MHVGIIYCAQVRVVYDLYRRLINTYVIMVITYHNDIIIIAYFSYKYSNNIVIIIVVAYRKINTYVGQGVHRKLQMSAG